MLFYTSMSDDDITQWVSEIPGEDHDKAHPLPKEPGLEWDCDIETAKRIKVKLVDLGQGSLVLTTVSSTLALLCSPMGRQAPHGGPVQRIFAEGTRSDTALGFHPHHRHLDRWLYRKWKSK